jgi:hypothetical protein
LFPAKNVRCSTLAFSLVLLVVTPAFSVAQDTSAVTPQHTQLLQQHFDELVAWLDDYKKWEEWMLRWGNRVAFNAAGGIVHDRPERPEPPDWLAADCKALLVAEGKLGEACAILARWDGIGEMILQQKHRPAVPAAEVQPKSSFLRRIHFSAGWVPAQLPAPELYLVAGMQVGIVEVGRATLPAVGVGLMAVADGSGGFEWKPATVIGIGYRLASFGFPGLNREANLHINIARATIHGASTLPAGFDPSQNLVGFSLTFK